MSVTAALLEPSLDTIHKDEQNEVEHHILESWQIFDLKRDRLRNADFADFLVERGFGEQSKRLRECGSILGFWQCDGCGEPRKLQRTFCNQPKICGICARIERRKTIEEVDIYLKAIESRPRHGFHLRYITLPIKTEGYSEESLKNAIESIWVAFKKLWRNDLVAKGAGAKVFLEVGPKNGNIHLHVLFYGPWIDQSKLSARWLKYTGTSSVVDIQDGRGKTQEIVKYVCKGLKNTEGADTDFLNDLVFNSWRALHGKYRKMAYGIFRKNVLEAWIEHPVHVPPKEEPLESIGPCLVCKSDSLRYILGNVFQRGPPIRPILEVISE